MTTETPTYTPEQRIRLALGRMPYLPLVAGYSISPDPESLARTLEGFATELTRVAEENLRREQELSAIRSDLAAVRRVLGTPWENSA